MAKGKQTCKILKEIRKQIAAENDIDLVVSECTYQGDCLGTCPKCEAEVRYLERELEKRQRMGKAAVFAGMSLGTLFAATSCNHPVLQPTEGDPVVPDTTELTNDTHTDDTFPDDALLLEGEVMVPEPDTMKAEEKKTACKADVELVIPGDIVEVDEALDGYVAPEVGEVENFDMVDVYTIVEQMPEFPGGEAKLLEFIKKNTRYPQEAKDVGIQGRVFVYFVVETDGSIGDVKILRGIGGTCDEEAMRVVKSMPKWKPGMHNGEFVRVSYQIPIFFKLEDTQE